MFDVSEYLKFLIAGKVNEAITYQTSCVPEYLYKFYSLTDEEDGENTSTASLNAKKLATLKENANWYDLPCNQNDPFEMKMLYIDEELAEQKGASTYAVDTAKQVLTMLQTNFLLCSFIDTDVNNLPMWAAYANNHRGYCIRYKVTRPEVFRKIIYEPKRMGVLSLPLSLFETMQESSKQHAETKSLEIYRELFYTLLCTKHISWASENEFRIICPSENGSGQQVSNKVLGLIPTDVYVGVNCSEKHQRAISAICHDDLKCKVHKCSVGRTDFITIKEI